jgi:protein-S-isoprenylcysteine O-methyltransferase Ste14
MFLRALTAFLVLPGIMAGLLPALLAYYDPWRGRPILLPGAILVCAGIVLLMICARDFYVSGKGTLAPWDPPRHLVVVGLYRYSRNPMYISILTLLAGWALIAASPLLTAYLILFAVAFHLRIVLYEEPRLSKMFGEEWAGYSARVPRWIGSRPGIKS